VSEVKTTVIASTNLWALQEATTAAQPLQKIQKFNTAQGKAQYLGKVLAVALEAHRQGEHRLRTIFISRTRRAE
jgi:hypothetical protein